MLKVADLLNADRNVWDLSKIDQHFVKDDKDAILSIPLGFRRGTDSLLWHYGRKGNYKLRADTGFLSKINIKNPAPTL